MKQYIFFNPLVLVFGVYCLLSSSHIEAQENDTFKYAFEASTDNDALGIWENYDRYYTFGIGLKFYFKSEQFLGLQKLFPSKKHYFFDVELRSEGYTPTRKSFSKEEILSDTLKFERPFAGLLYTKLNTTYTFERSFVKSELLLGIMGPSAFAAEIQNWLHKYLPTSDLVEGWEYQLPNQLIVNFNIKTACDLTPNSKLFDIYAAGEARFGNLYIDATPSLGFRFGKFNTLTESSAFNNDLLASFTAREFFLQTNISTTLAAFNGTAQGKMFGPKYKYALDHIHQAHAVISNTVYITRKRYTISFQHNMVFGKVIPKSRHIYGVLNLRYRFN
ncbi:DUF2219 family protein [Tamlana fucoidanivorans]|uniref:Lipid A deacylase LpxR family protein n=1 Tax=Allotamlana fucoidanivorans TaxID=2583814 RepID=A0A5C4SM10_9FLAO|nr:lipid A-modifier LpxR family protein [Tamlana fucoidanivorans]TNJ44732.1 lipid A deacylase LpxR family protein [Tamlana fucoidanivorans]